MRKLSSLGKYHAPSEDSDWTENAQADLNFRWAHMSEGVVLMLLSIILLYSGCGFNIFYFKFMFVFIRQYNVIYKLIRIRKET